MVSGEVPYFYILSIFVTLWLIYLMCCDIITIQVIPFGYVPVYLYRKGEFI